MRDAGNVAQHCEKVGTTMSSLVSLVWHFQHVYSLKKHLLLNVPSSVCCLGASSYSAYCRKYAVLVHEYY